MAQQLGANNVDKMSIEQMGEFLLKELALENLVLTLGAQGMAIFSRDQGPSKRIPTKAMEVFDVSGAGDTVIALLTASLVAGATIDEAAWIANLGAGIVVGKKGTATITAEELKSYYQQH
jgi:bifunctional ADP-heptose synthase (sugar kinase/adenylyltransferase)